MTKIKDVDCPNPSSGTKQKPKKRPAQGAATESSRKTRRVAGDPTSAKGGEPNDSGEGQCNCPVVGIGASAGGLAAFEAFFSGLPTDIDPGMAFVLVQHLAPDHKSILTDLVSRYTRMQVFEVEDGMAVRPNCAYIIPPNRDMAFLNGRLQLLEPGLPRGQRMPIDFFFRSLAMDQRDRAICIVLSGTGSDGTLGVRAIKGEGGMVMVQDPETTEYDGMPRSAIATGLVDFELPPPEMAVQLIAYADHAFGRPSGVVSSHFKGDENTLRKVFILLRSQTGHDFSSYKPSTINRRIQRRMAVHQIESMEAYLRYMQAMPSEVEALFRDLLIGVTGFFRDPEAFLALEGLVVPDLFTANSANSTIRVWSPGCSTGEEAYSLAILLQEQLEQNKCGRRVQVFATDIDSRAIAAARTGLYPASVAADISPERLTRFFSTQAEGGDLRISKGIRDMLVFSEQDVIKDPPFSRLDLISCRNLLIYMGAELQKKLIPLFHYALRPGGYLFLGTSESVGEFGDLFMAVDRKMKIYQRKEDYLGARPGMTGRFFSIPVSGKETSSRPAGKAPLPVKLPIREIAEKALLGQAVPAAVLVNGRGDVFYLHGRTGKYLEPTPGEPGTNNVLKMARDGLQQELSPALHKAAASAKPVRSHGIRVRTNGDFTTVNLTILPVLPDSAASGDSMLYLVVLDETASITVEEPAGAAPGPCDPASSADASIAALSQELRAKEEYLQTAIEELETSNEELKSSNEEMQSVNEELQSTNEELETSKEELQSVNEELATVNAELQTKVADLSRVNNDMNNLLAGTGIATIFVDHRLRILRFTPAATRIINMIASDLGRPVGHIAPNLIGYGGLTADIKEVLDTLVPRELEVQTTEGKWYAMRIIPYRTIENVIEGAVITFVDISEAKEAHEFLRLNEERMRVALKAVPIFVFNQDADLRYTWVCDTPLFRNDDVIGKTDTDLLPADEAAVLTDIKRGVIESGKGARQEVRISIDRKRYVHDLTVEPLTDEIGDIVGITGASMEVSAAFDSASNRDSRPPSVEAHCDEPLKPVKA